MARALRHEQMTPADELRDRLAACERAIANIRGSGPGARRLLEDMDRISELWPVLEAAGLDLRPEAGRWETIQASLRRDRSPPAEGTASQRWAGRDAGATAPGRSMRLVVAPGRGRRPRQQTPRVTGRPDHRDRGGRRVSPVLHLSPALPGRSQSEGGHGSAGGRRVEDSEVGRFRRRAGRFQVCHQLPAQRCRDLAAPGRRARSSWATRQRWKKASNGRGRS